jgi:hypothetical protein
MILPAYPALALGAIGFCSKRDVRRLVQADISAADDDHLTTRFGGRRLKKRQGTKSRR